MDQSDIVLAKYAPANPDVLNDAARAMIGTVHKWLAHHLLDVGEHPECEGQWAMRIMSDDAPFDFAPLSDLDIVGDI